MANYYKALEYRPDFPEASGNLGVIKYKEESDIQSSIEFMKTALEQGPDNNLKMLLYSNLMRLYTQIGDYDNKEYYNMKVLQLVGFPVDFGEEDDDEEEEEDEDEDEEIFPVRKKPV